MNTTHFVRLTNSAVLTVSGDDRTGFVQGQIANDIGGLAVGEARRSLALNLRGQAIADLTVLAQDDAYVLVVEDGMRDWLAATFDHHIIFDQVELISSDDYTHVSVQGPQAASRASALAEVAPFVWNRARSRAGGVDVLVKTADFAAVQSVLDEVGIAEVHLAEHTKERILAKLPLATQDAGEGVLPQEAGLEEALSYRKGCYLGQEIMARIEARGNLRRHLAQITVPSGAELPARAAIENDAGRTVGIVGSQAPLPDGTRVALAVLRTDVEKDTTLTVAGEVIERYDATS